MSFKLRNLVATALTSTVLFGLNGVVMADSNNDLVQALVAKGVLTEEEGALLTKGRAEEMGVQKKKESKFSTNSVKLRGYVQVRNTTMLSGDEGINLWSDRSVGDDKSLGDADKNFLIRRARLVVYGDYGDHLSYYIQPDFASSAGTTGNVAQLRDAYGDIYFDKTRVHRIRLGQSKVPFGFENLQSSQNRLALDRADALNSAVRDERDLGAFYYYTPEATQAMFDEIGKLGLKHTGNYGQFGIGVYNGQGANRAEQNDSYHTVARYTYPWKTESGQFYEVGIQGYKGEYVSSVGGYAKRNALGTIGPSAAPSLGTGSPQSNRNGIDDERVGLSFMMYPQPFGIQAEWNWGNTPGLDIASNTIEKKSLNGGYIQAMYKIDNVKFFDTNGTVIPFIKYQYFDGYNKAETNSPKNQVHDWEMGVEWQIAPEVEIAAVYHRMNRTNLVTGNRTTSNAGGSNLPAREDYENFSADALRVQVQYNY